jgi:hypothetical protein
VPKVCLLSFVLGCTGVLDGAQPPPVARDAASVADAGTHERPPSAACAEPPSASAPPSATAIAPDPSEPIAGTSVALEVELTDTDSSAFVVTFYARELVEEDDFTIVVMPDTQYYADTPRGWQRYFYDQTTWMAAHRAEYDIRGVIHVGDVVEHGDRDEPAWQVAERAFRTIEAASPGFPHGIPYGISVGNHDQTPLNSFGGTRKFNEHFGIARFSGRAYYGGHYGSKNDESWFTFSANGLDFVVVNLQFGSDPHPEIVDWARSIFEAHPEHFGILNSHYILNADASWGSYGAVMYDRLKDVANLQIMTCGHIGAEAHRTDDFEGNVIHSMLADYQFRDLGGAGYMRLWEFSPANDELTIRTYSPSLDRWETDADSEYTLSVDLSGAGGAFVDLARVDPAGTTASTTLEGLSPDRIYEWYARASDCVNTVQTPIGRFRTAP